MEGTKRLLPVLVFFAGLGSCFSFAQAVSQTDPFHRYLSGVKAGKPEGALTRFAQECGVDLQVTKPRFAKAPGGNWIVVKDLARALDNQETDYFGTVAVWTSARRTLVEYWGVDLELGSQLRKFSCLQESQIQLVEHVDWAFFEGEGLKGHVRAHWLGYEQRWKRKSVTSYSTVLLRYVNLREQPVPTPKEEDEVPYASEVFPKELSWEDLKLPTTLLH